MQPTAHSPQPTVEEEIDLDKRELCSDGACTGVLGEEGLCKICGRAGDGSAPSNPETVGGELSAVETFADRQLCPDGNCVGLIGEDGQCKLCRKPAAAS